MRHAGFASAVLPGVGQFMIGNPLSGTGFLLLEAALVGGTIAGTYFLMPEDVLTA